MSEELSEFQKAVATLVPQLQRYAELARPMLLTPQIASVDTTLVQLGQRRDRLARRIWAASLNVLPPDGDGRVRDRQNLRELIEQEDKLEDSRALLISELESVAHEVDPFRDDAATMVWDEGVEPALSNAKEAFSATLDNPSYLVRSLGPYVGPAKYLDMYNGHASLIEAWRQIARISSSTTAMGMRPNDSTANVYDAVVYIISIERRQDMANALSRDFSRAGVPDFGRNLI